MQDPATPDNLVEAGMHQGAPNWVNPISAARQSQQMEQEVSGTRSWHTERFGRFYMHSLRWDRTEERDPHKPSLRETQSMPEVPAVAEIIHISAPLWIFLSYFSSGAVHGTGTAAFPAHEQPLCLEWNGIE